MAKGKISDFVIIYSCLFNYLELMFIVYFIFILIEIGLFSWSTYFNLIYLADSFVS
jgi:hypothetical protein